VCPAAITTLLSAVGTTPPTQVAVLLQFPDAAEVIVVGVKSSTEKSSIKTSLVPHKPYSSMPNLAFAVRYADGTTTLIRC